MKKWMPRSFWLVIGLLFVMFTAAGCLKASDANQEFQAPVAQFLPSPTFTPTLTPEPTATPTPSPELTEEFSAQAVITEEVAAQATEEVTETATEDFGFEGTPVAQITEDITSEDQAAFLTATQLILEPTLTAAALTQAWEDQFSVTLPTETPTPDVFVPTATLTPAFGSVPPVTGADCIHTVSAGENLFRIGLRYGVAYQDIALASGIVNLELISIGQQLTIPGCGTTGQIPPPTSAAPVPPGSGAAPGTGSGGGRIHVVQQYETLFQISMQYNVPIMTIAAANNISNPNLIYFGQELIIP